MSLEVSHDPVFVYTFAYHEDERELCRLELRCLFNQQPEGCYVESSINIDPSRSPFMKARIEVQAEAASLEEIIERVKGMSNQVESTFKVVYVDSGDKHTYEEQRDMERQIGLNIKGKADMRHPHTSFGIAKLNDKWVFGTYRKSEAVWLQHNTKPQHYSTALSTRMARAVVNIAVPDPRGMKVIDPCCGIGTVLIEGLSMGMDMVGSDVNPMAVRGARVNLAHFDMPSEAVSIANIEDLEGDYDVAIIDLPYNLCSVLSDDERLRLLQSARRLAGRVIIITTESIDKMMERVGFLIVDRCVVHKGHFSRQVLVCIGG
ncbi:hypothetical protein D3C73_744120 [compost metagenome]